MKTNRIYEAKDDTGKTIASFWLDNASANCVAIRINGQTEYHLRPDAYQRLGKAGAIEFVAIPR